MITVKKEGPQPETKTLTEIFDLMTEALEKAGRTISADRQHSVDSHLRAMIRILGYRPRETAAKPATIPELLAAARQALALANGEVPEQKRETFETYALATWSNLDAEARWQRPEIPVLPELPPAKPASADRPDTKMK